MDDPVYCSASGGCDEFISLVQFGTIYKGTACSGYADYTNLSTSFPANGSEQITVTNGPPVYSADECGIWVDWNRMRDFMMPMNPLQLVQSRNRSIHSNHCAAFRGFIGFLQIEDPD
ncbi:MAG: hypothetical protein R2764_10675 [Bacteroidales bacterium]